MTFLTLLFFALLIRLTVSAQVTTDRLRYEIEPTGELLNDAVVAEYVNRVGQNIARNSDLIPLTAAARPESVVLPVNSMRAETRHGACERCATCVIKAGDRPNKSRNPEWHVKGGSHSGNRHSKKEIVFGNKTILRFAEITVETRRWKSS